MTYELLDGSQVNTAKLTPADVAFLLELARRALSGEDYYSLALSVSGKGAYPLGGASRVTSEVHGRPLYRIAEDIADRAAIRQGKLAPSAGESIDLDAVVGADEAAGILGISKSAVVKAAQSGRIAGKKLGKNTWALLLQSVASYSVSEKRVLAGRRARQATVSK